MIDTHLKSLQNQFMHLDTVKILTAPLCILLVINSLTRHVFIQIQQDSGSRRQVVNSSIMCQCCTDNCLLVPKSQCDGMLRMVQSKHIISQVVICDNSDGMIEMSDSLVSNLCRNVDAEEWHFQVCVNCVTSIICGPCVGPHTLRI